MILPWAGSMHASWPSFLLWNYACGQRLAQSTFTALREPGNSNLPGGQCTQGLT